MAKGMWLEHPEAQEQAIGYANALRDIAEAMPEGPHRETVEDAATFLGMISDEDDAPRTEEEMRDGRARAEARRGELESKRAQLIEASANLRAKLAAEAANAAE